MCRCEPLLACGDVLAAHVCCMFARGMDKPLLLSRPLLQRVLYCIFHVATGNKQLRIVAEQYCVLAALRSAPWQSERAC